MPGGRPCKLTPDLQARFCQAIASGNYYQAACAFVGLDYRTFRYWMKRGKKARRGKFFQFFHAVKKAEADRPAAARLISTVCSRFRDELGYDATLKALSWVKWTDLADNVRLFGLDGQPPLFDRVYNQADSIWINYPQAEITDRFAPVALRDSRVVRRIWEAGGDPAWARPA